MWLEAGAFLLLLLIVAMRPLVSETYESGLHAIARALEGGEVVTPARTAWFDLGIWIAALATAAAVVMRRGRWRWTGGEAGWVLLVLGAVVSTLLASNARLAASASADWLTTLVLVMVVANLCRNRLRIGLLLAVIAATGVTSAARSVMQVSIEFAETRQQYLDTREEFWRRQGVELDDPRVEMFERRMRAEQATGFFPHSNTQGSWLALAGFAALACGGLTADRRLRPLFLVLAAMLLSTILTTGSRGALGAAVIGLVLWLALVRAHEVLRRNWRAALVGSWLLVAVAAAAVVGVGTRTGGLYESSLTFRWQYWEVTRQIIADHLHTGVGALNFDRAYLLRKPIEYPEEIKDPHNFVLAVLAQWGLPGGVGLIVLMVGMSIVGVRDWARQPEESRAPPPPETEARGWRWVLLVAAGFLVLRTVIHRGLWLAEDPGSRALALFDLGLYVLLWIMAFCGIMACVLRGYRSLIPGYAAAALCGVIAFLLHNMIDFAIFYPGALTPFAALLGLLLAGTAGSTSDRQPRPAGYGVLAVAAAGTLVFAVFILIPVHRSARHLVAGRTAPSLPTAERHFNAAAAADRLDPTALLELARLHAYAAEMFAAPPAMERPHLPADAAPDLALRHLNLALAAADEAFLRDPWDMGLVRLRSRLFEMRYRLTGSEPDMLAAIGLGRQALSFYPRSPDEHLTLADLLARAAQELESPELAAEAVEHYQAALDLDAARPGTDEVRRWSATRREEIARRLQLARDLSEAAPASEA